MKLITVSEWIFDFLSKNGVDSVFFLSGGGSMYLNNALNNSPNIKGIPCHHEQACGIAAEASGRVSENKNFSFGVALVTSGPGATNIITPVAGAWIESLPLFIISGQVKSKDRLNGRKTRQSGTQEIDITSLVRPITKYAITLESSKDVIYAFEKAMYEMLNGRKGPVWVDIPLDFQNTLINPRKLRHFKKPVLVKNEKKVNKNTFKKITDLISKSKRPVIIGGHGIRLSSSKKEFLKLVEKYKIPFLTTWPALDLIEYDHPLNMGRPGVVAPRSSNFVLQNSDLVITIGTRLDNNITAYNPQEFARAAKKIIVDIDKEELKNKKNIGALLVKDSASNFISLFMKNVPKFSNNDWVEKCQHWKKKYDISLSDVENIKTKNKKKFSHLELINSLSIILPHNELIVTGSSGLAVEFFYAYFKNKRKQRVIHTSGLGAMGYGLPAAVGACVSARRKVFLIESDGSFQLNIQELATIKSQNLNICIILMNNGGYASIRSSQKNHFKGNYKGCDNKTGLFFPSLQQIAKSYGFDYSKAFNFNLLKKEIESFVDKPRPIIIETLLVESENLEPKCSAIIINGKIMSMPLEDMSPLLKLEDLENEMLIPISELSKKVRSK
jgi:acetolactate synthase-1/2/3 large subunit